MKSRDRLRGSLDVLILKTLSGGPMHGYAICQWLAQRSDDELRVEAGSLYPALYRMEEHGWLASGWQTSELGRPAKEYRLTAAGRKRLADETAEFLSFTRTVTRVLALQV